MPLTNSAAAYYFVPKPSGYPALAAGGVLLIALGAAQWLHGVPWGPYCFGIGLISLWAVLFAWFRQSIGESERGQYGRKVDLSFRWSMSAFIFSEVMFFASFFAALWWTRCYVVPQLGSMENALLWPNFTAAWPGSVPGATASPANIIEPFSTVGPLWLPTINTALLLLSGVTLTIAHHFLRRGSRGSATIFMWLTIYLGATFVCVQAYEYSHAYLELNLKLSSGIYGSTFYLLTGFHGFHVILGLAMLVSVTLRLQKGHFSPESHFGFEGAAWYWHFVDVVWLGLYVVVYWL